MALIVLGTAACHDVRSKDSRSATTGDDVPSAGAPEAGQEPSEVATGGSGAVGGGGTTSSGCGEPAPFTGRKALTVAVGGAQRQYDALVPASYDPERPLAVVFVFHGADGYIDEAMSWSGELREYGDAGESAVFLFPQGLPFQDYGVGWDEACEGVDMPFFDAMLRQTAESFCVATDRVFATGFSWGGDFVNALGCCRAEAIRGLVSLSGGEWGAEIGANGDCGSAPMPPYRLLYGDRDTAYSSEAFESVLQMFADANHCDSRSEPVDPSPCVVRTGCDRPVSECRYAGLVHAFAPNWAEATWAFFSSLR